VPVKVFKNQFDEGTDKSLVTCFYGSQCSKSLIELITNTHTDTDITGRSKGGNSAIPSLPVVCSGQYDHIPH